VRQLKKKTLVILKFIISVKWECGTTEAAALKAVQKAAALKASQFIIQNIKLS
jgi:hypothetical protein